MNINKIKTNILELCSESEYGSWEFWSARAEKTDVEGNLILQAIIELVKEKMIVPTEYKFVIDKSYKEVVLDEDRLKNEIEHSQQSTVNSETFYWFYATKMGKSADFQVRASNR